MYAWHHRKVLLESVLVRSTRKADDPARHLQIVWQFISTPQRGSVLLFTEMCSCSPSHRSLGAHVQVLRDQVPHPYPPPAALLEGVRTPRSAGLGACW